MSIAATCPNCQSRFELDENLIGKTIRCGKCKGTFPIGVPNTEAAVTPPPLPAATPPPLPSGRSKDGFDVGAVPVDLLFVETPSVEEMLKEPGAVVIRQSATTMLLYLLLAILGVVILLPVGLVVFFLFFILGGAIMLLGGLCLIAIPFLAWSVFDRSPKLVLTTVGLFNNVEGKKQFIAWLRIKEMEQLRDAVVLVLRGRDGQDWDREIPLTALTESAETICGKIDEHLQLARRRFTNGLA